MRFHLCPLSIRQLLNHMASLQLCAPLLNLHYSHVTCLLTLYLATSLLLLQRKRYITHRSLLLLLVRVLPVAVLHLQACAKGFAGVTWSTTEGAWFDCPTDSSSMQLVRSICSWMRLECWQLRQLVLVVAGSWHAISLPVSDGENLGSVLAVI